MQHNNQFNVLPLGMQSVLVTELDKQSQKIAKFATNAFDNLLNHQQNQAFIFLYAHSNLTKRGDHQKSLARLDLTNHLIKLARNGKKKSRVLSGALKIESCLESFGCCRLNDLVNSAQFGRLTGMYYYNPSLLPIIEAKRISLIQLLYLAQPHSQLAYI